AALIIIYGGDGVVVQWLGNLFGFGPIYTSWLAPLFTLICVLGVINAINMVDGMDGLAGALMLVSVGWFIVLCVLSNRPVLLQMLLVLVGIIIGFLVFNMRSPWRRVANIFMGNAGSMSLGLLITWLAVQLSGKINNEVSPIISVWVIGMPLMDMARVMIKRMREGKSPFVGDHSHVHHMLSSVGYSVEQVVLIKSVLSFLIGGIGVLGWYLKLPDWLMFYGFLLVLAAYFYLTGPGWRHICHHIERKRLLKEQA
ncbi:MAG: MraY family glycosyltransferase, partial [Methylotenera sp.]